MPTVTKRTIEQVLTQSLSLKESEFRLEKVDGRWMGDVISNTFKGKSDRRRQDMIRNALYRAFGTDPVRFVGMILAFTRDEWNLSDLFLRPKVRVPTKTRGRAAGKRKI